MDFINAVKIWEEIFSFLDHLFWIGCHKLSLLPGKKIPSGVNVLKNVLKISDITNKDFSQLKFFQRDE